MCWAERCGRVWVGGQLEQVGQGWLTFEGMGNGERTVPGVRQGKRREERLSIENSHSQTKKVKKTWKKENKERTYLKTIKGIKKAR